MDAQILWGFHLPEAPFGSAFQWLSLLARFCIARVSMIRLLIGEDSAVSSEREWEDHPVGRQIVALRRTKAAAPLAMRALTSRRGQHTDFNMSCCLNTPFAITHWR